jgi:tetraprenyl-beta-curcumene synthase
MFCCVVFSGRKAVGVVARIGEVGSLAAGFLGAARGYWLGVFPRVRGEAAQWRRRALEIPDATLRRAALTNLYSERLNLDGAAAFAAFVPEVHRLAVVRAQVAFQAAYDYVDTLAEQPCRDPIRNGAQLHAVLRAALDPATPQVDYYAHHPHNDDAGYLCEIVETCRVALRQLPSYAAVAAPVRRAVRRMVSYQSLNLNEAQGDHVALARWATVQTPAGVDLNWWETAASAGSSLGVYVLIAAAASRTVCAEEAVAIERAYFPWIGSLHLLLDSLVDRCADLAVGQPSLLANYSSCEEAAARLGSIAAEAMSQLESLPGGRRHMLLFAGMAGHYLSMPTASGAQAQLAGRCVREAIGGLAVPTMFVMGARRAAAMS